MFLVSTHFNCLLVAQHTERQSFREEELIFGTWKKAFNCESLSIQIPNVNLEFRNLQLILFHTESNSMEGNLLFRVTVEDLH